MVLNFCSLTVHFLTDDFERTTFVLHAQPMTEERHTADHLREIFEQMLENWKIEKKAVIDLNLSTA